jgi:hypothetical protein
MFQKKNQKILSKKSKKIRKFYKKMLKKKIFCSLLFEQSYHKVFFSIFLYLTLMYYFCTVHQSKEHIFPLSPCTAPTGKSKIIFLIQH